MSEITSADYTSHVISLVSNKVAIMKKIPGCGNGLIATKDIPAGTVIISEPGTGFYSPECCHYHRCRCRLSKYSGEEVAKNTTHYVCKGCNNVFCNEECYKKAMESGVHELECKIFHRVFNEVFFAKERGFGIDDLSPVQVMMTKFKYAAYSNAINLICKMICSASTELFQKEEDMQTEIDKLSDILKQGKNDNCLYEKQQETKIMEWYEKNSARLMLSTCTFGFSKLASTSDKEETDEEKSKRAEKNIQESQMLQIDRETRIVREHVVTILCQEFYSKNIIEKYKQKIDSLVKMFAYHYTGFIDENREIDDTSKFDLSYLARDIFNRCIMSQYSVEALDRISNIKAKTIKSSAEKIYYGNYDHTLSQGIYTIAGMTMFSLISRINNNCTPNAIVSFPNYGRSMYHGENETKTNLFQKADVGFAGIIAIRNIKEGEQICTNYLNITENPWRKHFEQPWRFTCKCERCIADNLLKGIVEERQLNTNSNVLKSELIKEEAAKCTIIECPICENAPLLMHTYECNLKGQMNLKTMRPDILFCTNCGTMKLQQVAANQKLAKYIYDDKVDKLNEIHTVFEKYSAIENAMQYINLQRCAEKLLSENSLSLIKKQRLFEDKNIIPTKVHEILSKYNIEIPCNKGQNIKSSSKNNKKNTNKNNQPSEKVDNKLFHLYPESIDCVKGIIILIIELTNFLDQEENTLKLKQKQGIRKYIMVLSEMAIIGLIKVSGGCIEDDNTYTYGGEITGGTIMWLFNNTLDLILKATMEVDESEDYKSFDWIDYKLMQKIAEKVATRLEGDHSNTLSTYRKVLDIIA